MGNKGKDLVAAKAMGWIKTVTLQLKHPKPLDTPEEDMFVIFSVDKILQTPLSLLQDGSTTQQITASEKATVSQISITRLIVIPVTVIII